MRYLMTPHRNAVSGRHAGIVLGWLRVNVWTRQYAAVTLSVYVWRVGFTLDIGEPS